MIPAFLDFLRFEKRASEHTIKGYQSDLDQFQKYLLSQYEITEPQTASGPMLRSWVVSLMEHKLNPSSINRKIASLRAYYGFLKRKKHTSSDPTKILSALKTKKKLPAFVEEKAMENLFAPENFTEDFTGLRDRVVLELLYGSGIRLAELLTLEVKDLNIPARTIRVFGKRSKERIVPVSSSLAALLQQYVEQRESDGATDALIVTNAGKEAYPVFIQRIVKRYLSLVTTLSQRSPHVLRHTYATHLLNRGADLNAIKELLGHANLAATQVYTHNSIEKLKKSHQQAHPKA